MSTTTAAGRSARLLPLTPVGLAVAFNLVVLRSELTAVQTPNDLGMHLSMIRWASHRLADGHLPFDGWYPYLGLGSPQFSQYPTLAHVVTGVAARAVDAATAARWSEYLLLATWPTAVYLGARLMGLDRWTAAGAAVVAPFLTSVTSYGLELSSYVWRGFGIWPQVWAQWLLPLSWGLSWRAIHRRGPTWVAACAVAATFALHFVTGYVCVLGVGALALEAVLQPGGARVALARVGRAALVLAGAMTALAYVVVPLLLQRRWASFPGLDRRSVEDSAADFGLAKAIRWLLTGELYDHGRLPIVTALVLVGLVMCVLRRRPAHRAVLAVWAVSFAVFAAGSALGVRALLPGSSDLFTRFIIGVHLSGVLAAGVGAAEIAAGAHKRLTGALARPGGAGARLAAAVVAVAALVALSPAWLAILAYQREGQDLIAEQRRLDATDGADVDVLLDRVRVAGGGRVYAGSSTTWGPTYRVGSIPLYMWLDNHDVDGLGFTYRVGSLSSEVEVNFIDVLPGEYPLFGIRYLLTPTEHPPPAGLDVQHVATVGRHTLWEVTATSGYVEVVDTRGSITADAPTLGQRVLPFLASVPAAPREQPVLALAGDPAAAATDPSGTAVGAPGSVSAEHAAPADGRYAATVQLQRGAAVVLRTSYSGKWSVRVDGRPATAYPVAPSFVAVTVPAGRHDVVFTYEPYEHYALLWGVGAAGVAALALFDRRPVWLRRLRGAGARRRRLL